MHTRSELEAFATRTAFARPAAVVAALLLVLWACSAQKAARPEPLRTGIAAFDTVDPLAHLDRIAALGFAYIEPALSKLAALPDAEIDAVRARVAASRLRAEAMNWFLPPDLLITGPAVDDARIESYLERALPIAASFGTRVIVFGSPKSRTIPDGFPRDRAQQQLVAFLRRCADVIERHRFDLTICIEALRRPETNVLNSVREAMQLARDVDRPQVRIVVDFYHLAFENEDPAVVREAAPWIAHLQIADPRERGYPRSEDGEPRYAQFFDALAEVGYRGRISIEAISQEFDADAAAGRSFLRRVARVK
ncbi:MAG: sugar phosphate isomerase/epimerase family protein [Planctomycetota bacterium]